GTEPAIGTTVESGQAIPLLVSNAVKSPGVRGPNVAEARATREGRGLPVQVRPLTPRASWVVISPRPSASRTVAPGTTVTRVALP
ncbi:serine/threonine protein kinase, partial [Nocardia farcinica]|nr:serine/threonine protein kinase [Nocardia farcinica]